MLLDPVSAAGLDFSFRGTFSADDDVKLFSFVADGASTVTLHSYGYAGGTQADGTVISAGGFDPILALFDDAGNLIDENDDGSSSDVGTDPGTGGTFDTFLQVVLSAGTYTATLMQFDNFATGPTLAAGFDQVGNPFFTASNGCSAGQFCDVFGSDRTSFWAFDVLGVESAAPEPGTGALMAFGLAMIGTWRSRSRK